MNIREHIVDKLMVAGGFWSYDKRSVRKNMSDDQLIEAALEKLDLDDIDLLFRLFPAKKIKDVWRRTMVVQGDYYYSLNRFFAWYYFGIRYPDRYLKAMMTRHLSKLTA
ncbi:MAG TPA: hypothetical protein PKZ47_04290 [Alistipes sp.]|uniref:hypothetical protein n=2 Tax=unclassified Alistipes TaxID=2608932 RepID=UPI002D1089BF|nr:hypothetical protein [Alistipes sp.]HUN14233.1 hypothetical protein [Alistipes sp.]